MFFKLFNWLAKRVPYVFSVIVVTATWSLFVAAYGAIYIAQGADFSSTGTGPLFVFVLAIAVAAAILLKLVENGLFRIFGRPALERRESRVINDWVSAGRLRRPIGTDDLLGLHRAVKKIHNKLLFRDIQLTFFVIFAVVGAEALKGSVENALVIAQGGLIALVVFVVGSAFFHEMLIAPLRKEIKILLAARGKKFEEPAFLSFKTKIWFFIVVLFLGLFTISSLFVRNISLTIIVFLAFSFFIFYLLSELILKTIYKNFEEVKESAKKLEKGEKTAFFTGGLDREIIDLSESLNKTAETLHKNKKELEEAKKVLEVKVAARTRELEELNRNLGERVKKKTAELRERVEELEKFQKLTVGRELEMVELKKELRAERKKAEKLEKELAAARRRQRSKIARSAGRAPI